ncbi:MAG: DUF2232 domain-containing protein [bacterium]
MSSNQERYNNGCSNSKSVSALKKISAVLGSLFLVLFLCFISQLFLVAFIPIPLTFLILRRGKSQWVIGALLVAGIVALIAMPEADLIFYALVIFGSVSIVLAELFERGLTSERIIFISSIVSIALLFFFLGMYSLRSSTGLDESLHHEISQSMSKVIELYEQGGIEPDQVALLKKSSQQIEDTLISIFPAILAVLLIFVSSVNYFILRHWLQSLEFPVEDRKPFWYWILPDFWVWVFIVAGLMWYFLKMPLPSRVGLNFLIVVSCLYLIQGLAVIVYFFHKVHIPAFLRYLGVAFILFIPGSYILLTLGGLFDNWIDFRKLRPKAGETSV